VVLKWFYGPPLGMGIGRPSQQRRVVLRCRNTFVGGKCALPSALLLVSVISFHYVQLMLKRVGPNSFHVTYSDHHKLPLSAVVSGTETWQLLSHHVAR